MYLKSLVLKGFKSFVDRSQIVLEPGISAIVGPNGSGKSNISDAILWVLGEQSAKQLRGQVMEDIIFSGTSARSAVGIAEVDLVLDNSDSTLPLEFDEVVITRRMYRSGESEYLINGAPALLRDIVDILHDSGIGRDAHSVISQGSLNALLDARPEDRRALIEEAAGILKHKKRKERASRKLASMDASLERVNDIAREIDRQLRPLQRQATQAQEHKELSTEIEQLELQIAVSDLRALQSEWQITDKQLRESDAEMEIVRYRYEDREKELEKLQKTLEEKGLFAGDLTEQRSRCQSILQRLNSNMLLLEEKGKNMVDRASELRGKLHRGESRLTEATTELEAFRREQEEVTAAFTTFTRESVDLNRESEQIRKIRSASDEEYHTLSSQLRGNEKAIDECNLRLTKARQALETNRIQNDMLADRLSQIEDQLSTTQSVLATRRGRLAELEGDLDRNRRESELAKLDIDKRVRLLDAAKRELEGARDAQAAIRAEMKGLAEVDRAFETASPALTWVYTHEFEYEGRMRPISDMFTAPSEYEFLIERLLGADLLGMVLSDADSASLLAQRLLRDTEGEGGISIIPLDTARDLHHGVPQSGQRLLDKLEFDESDLPAAEALLGDVYLVDDVASAVMAQREDLSGSRFVAGDGSIVWPNGKITLGIQNDDVEGVLARKSRLDSLECDLEDATAVLTDAEMKVSTAEENLKTAQEDGFELSQNIAHLLGDSEAAREDIGRLEQQIGSLAAESDQVISRREAVEQSRLASQPQIADLEARIVELTDTCAALEETIEAGSDQREKNAQAAKEILERISACKVELATSQTRSIYIKQRIQALSLETDDLKKSIDVFRNTEASLDVLRCRVDPLYTLFEELSDGARQWARKIQDQAQFVQTDSSSLREAIDTAKEAAREAKQALDDQIAGQADIRIEKGKIEIQVESAIANIEKNGVVLETALMIPPPTDRHAAEDRLMKLQRRKTNMGPVNQVAMKEYEALKDRREFIADQVDDLASARKSLSKIVAAIDRKMRNRFLETFEQVDENFQDVFAQLFPGGNGHLVLTDPEDPDNTGIEIDAQPAGKHLRKRQLMSGGEISLTALALLFSVYRTRTVPFYVLDEVEAALDDTNLRRLVSYLDSLRDKTQFIIITHQRRTMEMADVLYGVSMQADGVSKIVSQKLDHEAATSDARTPEDFQHALDVDPDLVHPVSSFTSQGSGPKAQPVGNDVE